MISRRPPELFFAVELLPEPLQALFEQPGLFEQLQRLNAGVCLAIMDFSPQRLEVVHRLNAAITRAGGTALRTPDQCQWQQDKIGNWLTRCGCIFWKEYGDPSDIGMDFCPFCGRPIEAP